MAQTWRAEDAEHARLHIQEREYRDTGIAFTQAHPNEREQMESDMAKERGFPRANLREGPAILKGEDRLSD